MKTQSKIETLPFGHNRQSLVDVFMGMHPKPNVETAQKGQIIVQEDDFADHSILLLEGWLALSKMLPDGETQIIDVMLPGDFALIGATNAPVAACSVDALSDARFIAVRPAQANGPEPEMAKLRELVAGEIVRSQARVAEILLRTGKGAAANRIAYALLEFYVRLDAAGLVEDNRFAFPMTQHKIGEFTGLSNVHVCRTMRLFERDGIIAHPTNTDIVLNNVDALCEIAGIDLKTFQHEILVQRTH
ncbi:Crp/Fnr family transcriptional regulator [Aliiroseovarius sp. S1339]|uniref:Crp/Fnr family transcriptional regulator n=1 Tax=Aliiroseovarius sp. S1339 TaxID=2936990 RepID=UPI0020BEDC6B|nr:Crp/Fnr family transcriptional regulator [Aliiroseovarius sp. S1339]MCK8465518.1 Crp/Fnr family transcriptional regulator [Aliiroseovarius sp. S1339]